MNLTEIAKRTHRGLLSTGHKTDATTAAITKDVTALGAQLSPPATPNQVAAAVREYLDTLPLWQRAVIALNDGLAPAELEQFAQRCDAKWINAAGVEAVYLASAARDLRQAAAK